MGDVRAAIVGISDTHVMSRSTSADSSFVLALDAIIGAAGDAGIDVEDIDGFCSFGLHGLLVGALVDSLGTRDFRFGGSALQLGGAGMVGALHSAVAAVESQQAKYVVVFKSLHSDEARVSSAGGYLPLESSVSYAPGYEQSHYAGSFTAPYGLYIPYEGFAMHAQRYMHDYDVQPEDLGNVAIAMREHALDNPRARFHDEPLTMEEYLASPMIADPLRKLDLCLENDFGVAFIVTTMERARDMPHVPVRIGALSYAVGFRGNRGLFGDPDYPNSFLRVTAERLWRESDYALEDMSNAQLFDMTTVSLMQQLEDIGFCGPGGAADYVRAGGMSIGIGDIPINTNGGQLSASYALGMTVFLEAVRQVRGDAVKQVGWPSLMAHSPYSVPAGLVVLDR